MFVALEMCVTVLRSSIAAGFVRPADCDLSDILPATRLNTVDPATHVRQHNNNAIEMDGSKTVVHTSAL